MNVDEAIAYASKDKCFWAGEVHTALETLAKEVERLRAETESVIRLGPHPVEQVQMPLATFVRSRFVWRWEYNELVEALENVRSELAQLRKDWCDDDEAIKQQALRVLDAAKVEGDSVYVPRMGALAEMMADELVKVHSELAAAKAEIQNIVSGQIKANVWEDSE